MKKTLGIFLLSTALPSFAGQTSYPVEVNGKLQCKTFDETHRTIRLDQAISDLTGASEYQLVTIMRDGNDHGDGWEERAQIYLVNSSTKELQSIIVEADERTNTYESLKDEVEPRLDRGSVVDPDTFLSNKAECEIVRDVKKARAEGLSVEESAYGSNGLQFKVLYSSGVTRFYRLENKDLMN